eukprot:m51a1_g12488 putative serine threonine-protein kinase nrc-2 (485) ;mRNA; f:1185-2984
MAGVSTSAGLPSAAVSPRSEQNHHEVHFHVLPVAPETPRPATAAAAAAPGAAPMPTQTSHPQIGPQSFTRLRLIGLGQDCARVYLAKHNETEQMVALKVIPKADMLRLNKVRRVMTEVEILRTVHHPFVVTLFYSFSTINCLYFVMEFHAGGPFYRMLKSQAGGCIPEKAAMFYAAEVLLAIEYLHLVGFMYRDLKPENLLLSSEGHIILTGFEMGKSTPTSVQSPCHLGKTLKRSHSRSISTEPHVLSNSFVGTDEYVAPEIITGAGHTSSVDWWTFGVFIYEMLYGVTPFRGQSRVETFSLILDGGINFPVHPLHTISKAAKSLIRDLLDPDGETRLGANEGACEIKQHPFFDEIDFNLIRNIEPPIVPTLSDKYDLRNFPELEDDGLVDRLEQTAIAQQSTQPVEEDMFRAFESAPVSRAASPFSISRSATPMVVPAITQRSPLTPAPNPMKVPHPIGLLAAQLAATSPVTAVQPASLSPH